MNIKAPMGAGALTLVALMAGAPAAQANPDTPVTIIDDQHYLNDTAKVTQEIKAKEFPSGMQVAVLLRDDSSFSQDGYDAEVKRYAMAHLPSALVNKKANDLNPKVMLITISPEIHKMGLYGGKETGINSTWVDSAVETMRPYAQSSDWDDMVIQGAEAISNNASPSTVISSSDDPSTYTGGDSITEDDPMNQVDPSLLEDGSSSQDDSNLPLLGGLGLGTMALLGGGGVLLARRARAKDAQALEDLYARRGDWNKEWVKRYNRATENEFSQLHSSMAKAKGHLTAEDAAKLEAVYNESLAEARRIHRGVLSGGEDVRISLDKLNSLNTQTRGRVSSITGTITPIGTPAGFTPRSGLNARSGLSSINPYDLIGVLWISQTMQHNAMHNNSMGSSFNNSNSGGGSMNGGDGGFSGGSGSW